MAWYPCTPLRGLWGTPYPPDAILGILANALYAISRPETSIWRVILEPSDGVPTHPGVLRIPLPEDLWMLWTHLVACHMAYAMYRIPFNGQEGAYGMGPGTILVGCV